MPGYGNKSSGLVKGKYTRNKRGYDVYGSMSGPKQGRKKKYAKRKG